MKKEKMLRSMELADEVFVAEADPSKPKKRVPLRLRLGVLAACFCLLLTATGLWLFMPLKDTPPDLSDYRDSEYYEIIQKLSLLTYRKPSYENRFEQFLSGFLDGFLKSEDAAGSANMGADGTMAPGMANGSQQYEEITDHQVDGVLEGDRIKRSDRYIYYLDGNTLRVYSIEGEASKELGSLTLKGTEGEVMEYRSEMEFYLSADCQTVTVIMPYYLRGSQPCVKVISVNVSNPLALQITGEVSMTGSYLSSRVVDGRILLMSRFHVASTPDFSDESTFLPQINTGAGMKSVPAADIICPETVTSARYTVVCQLEEGTLAERGSAAFLSFAEDAYVSLSTIYATRSYQAISERDSEGYVTSKSVTEIFGLSYGEQGFERKGSVVVDGTIKDQYSLDEYHGMLRVVTTTSASRYWEAAAQGSQETLVDSTASFINLGTSANLYCVDLSHWGIRSVIEGFAPKGETVRSVRFDETAAYVCTAVQLTDPVFFFDLSDPDHITYKDTGTIGGFSTSLIQWGEGYLLGIGVGSTSGLKIEVYREGEGGVESVCSYERKDTSYSTEYKSYYVDRENNLIGLGITSYALADKYNTEAQFRYLLLLFDGYELKVISDVALPGENAEKRGVLIDDCFYMFGENAFIVKKIVS